MDFKKKILVVEDSQVQRAICVSQLKQAGFENIEVAEDGNVAYSRLEEGEIELVLCDWEMPELDGIQLLKKSKKTPPFKVFLSSCSLLFRMKNISKKLLTKVHRTTSSSPATLNYLGKSWIRLAESSNLAVDSFNHPVVLGRSCMPILSIYR